MAQLRRSPVRLVLAAFGGDGRASCSARFPVQTGRFATSISRVRGGALPLPGMVMARRRLVP